MYIEFEVIKQNIWLLMILSYKKAAKITYHRCSYWHPAVIERPKLDLDKYFNNYDARKESKFDAGIKFRPQLRVRNLNLISFSNFNLVKTAIKRPNSHIQKEIRKYSAVIMRPKLKLDISLVIKQS